MTTSNSLALSFLRCAAASRYSGDSWQEIASSKLGNSMTTKRWIFSGPSRILNLPPRARNLPSNFPMIAGARSAYFLYYSGSLTFERATQLATISSSMPTVSITALLGLTPSLAARFAIVSREQFGPCRTVLD
jgi:hypothetical protein